MNADYKALHAAASAYFREFDHLIGDAPQGGEYPEQTELRELLGIDKRDHQTNRRLVQHNRRHLRDPRPVLAGRRVSPAIVEHMASERLKTLMVDDAVSDLDDAA